MGGAIFKTASVFKVQRIATQDNHESIYVNTFRAINKQQSVEPRILVKCGGFSSQLSCNIDEKFDGEPLWSARFDAEKPDVVVQTHLDFLQNGAQIILSNTYQASIEGFMKHLNLTKAESIQLIRTSVKLAKNARTKYLEQQKQLGIDVQPQPLVLASIGPYGAHLHDASEYSGNYADRVTREQIQEWHRPRIDACLAEGVDGLAVETLPCQMEAEAVVDMLLKDYPNVKFWISFTCKDENRLPHGENFADAVDSIWTRVQEHQAEERLLAIGVNCVNPRFVTSLFESLHAKLENMPPLVCYSNRGEIFDTQLNDWTGKENCIPLESYVLDWIGLGARIIGGCCRVYPADIQKIRTCIDNRLNKTNN